MKNISGMQKIRQFAKQKGAFLLLEMSAVSIIASMAVAAALIQQKNALQTERYQAQGELLKTLSASIDSYIASNYDALTRSNNATTSAAGETVSGSVYGPNGNNTTTTYSVANIYAPTIAELITAGFLSSGFSSTALVYASDNTKPEYSIKITPSPAANCPNCDLQGLVYLNKAVKTDEIKNLGTSIAAVGANGLFSVETSAEAGTTSTKLYGRDGSTQRDNPVSGTPAGILAASNSYSTSGLSNFMRIDGTATPSGDQNWNAKNLTNVGSLTAGTGTVDTATGVWTTGTNGVRVDSNGNIYASGTIYGTLANTASTVSLDLKPTTDGALKTEANYLKAGAILVSDGSSASPALGGTGSITASGAVSAGSISTTGTITGASISTTGAVSAGSISTTGAVSAGSISTTGTITASGEIIGNAFTGSNSSMNANGQILGTSLYVGSSGAQATTNGTTTTGVGLSSAGTLSVGAVGSSSTNMFTVNKITSGVQTEVVAIKNLASSVSDAILTVLGTIQATGGDLIARVSGGVGGNVTAEGNVSAAGNLQITSKTGSAASTYSTTTSSTAGGWFVSSDNWLTSLNGKGVYVAGGIKTPGVLDAGAVSVGSTGLTVYGGPINVQNAAGSTTLASIDASGNITGTSLNTGSGTIQTTGTISGGTISGTINATNLKGPAATLNDDCSSSGVGAIARDSTNPTGTLTCEKLNSVQTIWRNNTVTLDSNSHSATTLNANNATDCGSGYVMTGVYSDSTKKVTQIRCSPMYQSKTLLTRPS